MAQLLSGAGAGATGSAAAGAAMASSKPEDANGGNGMWYDLGQQMGQGAAEQAHSAPMQQPGMDTSWQQMDLGGPPPDEEQPIDFSSLLKFF